MTSVEELSSISSLRNQNQGCSRNSTAFLSQFSLFTWHSQIVCTFQPSDFNCLSTRRSLNLFESIFFVQKDTLLFDVARPALQECPCQKQPCTITILRLLGKTMSGRPGKVFTCSRNRKPSACNVRRTSSSGFVSCPLIRDISQLRRSGVNLSITIRCEFA